MHLWHFCKNDFHILISTMKVWCSTLVYRLVHITCWTHFSLLHYAQKSVQHENILMSCW